jgi:hypothetical protein
MFPATKKFALLGLMICPADSARPKLALIRLNWL